MAEPAHAAWPNGVSVIMPVLNEERHLAESVGGILTQDWAGPLEIVLALGPSTDRTDEVARRLSAVDERIVLVANPSGRTPSALNAAIGRVRPSAARGPTTSAGSCARRDRPRSSRRSPGR
jgi:succinoglycan biosynthesis protein ExoA